LFLILIKNQATKTWWSGGIAPLILNLSTAWRWAVSFTPRRKSSKCPLDGKLGGHRSGRGGKGKILCFSRK